MSKTLICSISFVLALVLCGPIASGQGNQIINGEFDDGLNSWNLYGAAGFNVEVVQGAGLSGNNAVMIDVTDASATASIGISQPGLVIEPGVTYPIGFRARAEEDRQMVVLLQASLNGSWPTYVNEIVELTTTAQDYVIEYTHTGDAIGDEAGETLTLYLMLKGQWWPMTGDNLNKKVWLDWVYFGAEPEVQQRGRAFNPFPADGVVYSDTWVNLTWSAGDFAVSHDVYLGDNFDDVNDGTGDTFRGNQDTTSFIVGFPGYPYPEGLALGTTYYWRIDEVNEADPNSPWKGDVWSFSIPPRKAYDPNPTDGVKFVNTDLELRWMAGLGAVMHTVYFGSNFDDVNEAVGGMPAPETTYSPGPLELDTTYYWRVDEFDGLVTYRGDVWSFTTMPDIPIPDPSLVGWWKLDEAQGSNALDWSGHDNHGALVGGPQWVAGQDGDALEFDGNNWVDCGTADTLQIGQAISIACWVNPAVLSGNRAFAGLNGSYAFKSFDNHLLFTTPGIVDHWGYNAILQVGVWQHVAVTFQPNQTGGTVFYIDGVEADRFNASDFSVGNGPFLIGNNEWNQYYTGMIDDVRVYNKVLTEQQIGQAMRVDLLLAWNPSPPHGSTVDIEEARQPVTWSPGDNAAQHDVYFGLDKMAVENANSSDATGIYRGRQAATSYTLPEILDWGTGPYYWRVDEYNTDGTISTGRIWSFTVVDHLIVDDFESYTDNDAENEAIWQTWIDGYNVADNGAQVGNLMPPYCEQTIVHGGAQSMPLFYVNEAGVTNSEGALPLTALRDWTQAGVAELSLWFRGDSANATEPMYVATSNAAGAPAIVANDDTEAALARGWKELRVPLQAFADQGINLTDVDKFAIGLGSKSGIASPGGSGVLYVDDIRLYRP